MLQPIKEQHMRIIVLVAGILVAILGGIIIVSIG